MAPKGTNHAADGVDLRLPVVALRDGREERLGPALVQVSERPLSAQKRNAVKIPMETQRALAFIWILLTGCGAIMIQVPEQCFSMPVPMSASATNSSGWYTSTQVRVLPTALIPNFDKLRELHVTRGTLTLPVRLDSLTITTLLPPTPEGWLVKYTRVGESALVITMPPSKVNLIKYVDSRGLISFQFAVSGMDALLARSWSMKAFVCLAGEASP